MESRVAGSTYRPPFRIARLLTISAFLCLLVPAFAAAQTEATYKDAADALYNLDFNIAERGFDSLIKKDPDNPEHWNGMASTILLRILYDQQKLNVDSFSGGSLGTRESAETVKPEDEKRLRSTIQTAINKANAKLAKNKNDIAALYALGVSNGTLASFEALAKKAYMPARGKAADAKKYHQQVLKLDPSFHDARLSLGVYDYAVGVMPWGVRALLGLFGLSGNKDAGIRNVEAAAAQGTRASTDAKMMLVAVYNREKRYDQAVQVIDQILAKYPRNFVLHMSKASIYRNMKNYDRAVDTYNRILYKIQSKQDGYDRMREERVLYEIAKSNVDRYRFDDAIALFSKVVNSSNSTVYERADSHLWLGRMFDSSGQRQKAVAEYDAILKLNCDESIKDEARRYKRSPFKA